MKDPLSFLIKILLGYLIFTEVIFFVGPRDYGITNYFMLIFYLVIVNGALYLGYKRGLKKPISTTSHLTSRQISIIICIGFALNVYNGSQRMAVHGGSYSLEYILNSLAFSGEAYANKTNFIADYPTIITLIMFLGFASIPMGIYAWKKIRAPIKCILVASILAIILSYIGIGTRKGILDMIIVVVLIPYAIAAKNMDKAVFRKLRVTGIAIISLFVFYFFISNLSRYGLSEVKDIAMDLNRDYKASYFQILPTGLISSLGEIQDYCSQGYNALARALDMGIIPLAPLGSNWFTIQMSNLWLNYDPTPQTYMYLLERQGIDMSVNWHTIYVWLANDFTFIGVPIIIYLIGYFLAKIWTDAIKGENPWAYPVAAYMVLMVFYFSANNQIMSDSFLPFWITVFIYLFTRRKMVVRT